RQLVLAEIARKEDINVAPEELEALYNAYTQMGQPLSRTEAQLRALAINYQREKALTHLLELTTDPDPDVESDAETSEEAIIANAQAAALAGETAGEAISAEDHTTGVDTEESAAATPLPEAPSSESAE